MDKDPVMSPIHPGVILREEFLAPLGVTDYQLAKAIGVPQTRISAITRGKRRITADTGLRLARYLGMSEQFWTGLQDDYDRELAKDRLGAQLDSIHPVASRPPAPIGASLEEALAMRGAHAIQEQPDDSPA